MTDPMYPLFSVFSFASFVLVLIPLPWHLQAWNSGTCMFMIWTAIGCLNLFINSIIWRDNVLDVAPYWCDFSTRLTLGVAVGIPAASLCINRRLYKIAACRSASTTVAEKRRAIYVDLAIGVGLPALQMILQFVVQGHRYDIWEEIGCYPTTVNTPAAYPLVYIWPNVISLVSGCYCVMTLHQFMKRRAQFSQFMSTTKSLTVNRYFRLMALATSEILITIPLCSYGLFLNLTSRPIYHWTSWSDIHFDWYIVDKFPSALWRSSPTAAVNLELTRWSMVFCGFVFFAFFGFADEARKHYRLAFWAVAKRFGHTPPSSLAASKISPHFKAPGHHLPLKNISPTSSNFTPRPFHLAKSDFSSTLGSTPSISDRTSLSKSVYSEPTLSPTSDVDFKVGSFAPSSPTTSSSYHSTYDLHDIEAGKPRIQHS